MSHPPALPRWLWAAAVAGTALAVQGCSASPANTPSASPHASAGTSCSLTVAITTTAGTTWGTVTASSSSANFTQFIFSSPSTTVAIPCRASVHFKERPIDSNTWPFRNWKVDKQTVTGTSASIVVNGAAEVRAVYVLAASKAASPTP